jgi:hypothetical protein
VKLRPADETATSTLGGSKNPNTPEHGLVNSYLHVEPNEFEKIFDRE